MTGYNYLGIIDDMVEKYPWRFPVTDEYFNHSLIVQVINGRPILINDGYLVLHPIARNAIMNIEGLIWELMRSGYGFVNVLSRGGKNYGLHEMPEAMMDKVETFNKLVNNKVKGAEWKNIKNYLKETDNELKSNNMIVNWPSYDMGSGYLALAKRLRERNSSARSVGLGFHLSTNAFHDFLDLFIERMEVDTSGARTYWEFLAKKFAFHPKNLKSSIHVLNGLMNLANEMYHYNMGIMLAAEHGVPISVETQTSPAFDDLLITKDILVEEKPFIPEIRVPKKLAKVDPKKIVQIFRPHLPVSKAREEWFRLKALYETKGPRLTDFEKEEIENAAKVYSIRLSEHLSKDIKYTTGESLFEYAVSSSIGAASVVGTVAGEVAGQIVDVPGLGGAVGIGSGYLVSRLQKKAMGKVTDKFKLLSLKGQILLPEQISKSKRVIDKIKRRRIPSSIEIDPKQALEIASRVKKFNT